MTKRLDKRREELFKISRNCSVEDTEIRNEAIVSGSSFSEDSVCSALTISLKDHSNEKCSRHGRDGRAKQVENVPGGTLKVIFRRVEDIGAIAIV